MEEIKKEERFAMSKLWGKRWIIISFLIIAVTGVAIYFFDNTNDSEFHPFDARPPAFKNQHDRAPVQLKGTVTDSLTMEDSLR